MLDYKLYTHAHIRGMAQQTEIEYRQTSIKQGAPKCELALFGNRQFKFSSHIRSILAGKKALNQFCLCRTQLCLIQSDSKILLAIQCYLLEQDAKKAIFFYHSTPCGRENTIHESIEPESEPEPPSTPFRVYVILTKWIHIIHTSCLTKNLF